MSHGVVPPALAGRALLTGNKQRVTFTDDNGDDAPGEVEPLLPVHQLQASGGSPGSWRMSAFGSDSETTPSRLSKHALAAQAAATRAARGGSDGASGSGGIPPPGGSGGIINVASFSTIGSGGSSTSAHQDNDPGPSHSPPQQFESLDFEEVENTVYRADLAQSKTSDGLFYTSAKWAVCLAIGVATAAAAFAVNLSVENICNAKFWLTLTLMNNNWYIASFLVYILINALLVLSSVAITVYFGPAAAGSGIAEVKAFLNGIDVPGIFYVNTLVAKVVGAVGSVAGGLAIGKEGPFVHAGACIAALLSQGGGSVPVGKGAATLQAPAFAPFWNDRDRADFVACGAAAGVAAAFRSPVGGLLFVLEEMTSWWSNQLLWLAFFTTAVVSVTVRVLMKACTVNGCGFFGSGGFIIFEIAQGQDNYEFYELLPMLLLGVVGGLLGSAFIVLNARLGRWRKRRHLRYGNTGKVVDALIISLLTSTVSFVIPLIFTCQGCPAEAGQLCPRMDNSRPGNFVSFGCANHHNGQYNGLATIFFNTQDDAIRNLFSSKTKREYTVSALTTFVVAFFGLAVVTYGVACPTGLFVPSILLGAAYGRLVGIFVADVNPGHYVDEGTYALLGAASFLGGAMRTTVSSCVMLLELTNNLALLPLVMLVLLVAKAVGDGTGVKSIYEAQMEVRDMPFLEPHATGFMRHVTAKEVAGKPAVTFQRVEKVRHIAKVLRSCQHNGFPVIANTVEGDKSMMGIILRHQLLVLLSSQKAFQPTAQVADAMGRVATTFRTPDFSKPMSTPGLTVEGVVLNGEQLEQYLDLGPYVNPSYYVVQEDASLSKVYTLFRTLGLRHVAVIPRATEVVGIITRRDLLPEVLERFTAGQYTTDGNNYHGMASGEQPSVSPSSEDGSGPAGAGFGRRRPGGVAGVAAALELTSQPSYHLQFDVSSSVA